MWPHLLCSRWLSNRADAHVVRRSTRLHWECSRVLRSLVLGPTRPHPMLHVVGDKRCLRGRDPGVHQTRPRRYVVVCAIHIPPSSTGILESVGVSARFRHTPHSAMRHDEATQRGAPTSL